MIYLKTINIIIITFNGSNVLKVYYKITSKSKDVTIRSTNVKLSMS